MSGMRILVTRPREQGERLAASLSAEGFVPIVAPMIRIVDLPESSQSKRLALLKSMASAEGIIAISSNAFAFAARTMAREGMQIPMSSKWFAVGNATADAMRTEGVQPQVHSYRFDTEGLLELPDLQDVSGKRFVILAGKGGRRKLEEVLRERGAEVERIELYQRVPIPAEEIHVPDEPDAIIAMSGETLDGLLVYIKGAGRSQWLEKPLLVPSARVANIAFDSGFQKVRVTENASEKSLLQALCRLASEV